MPDNIIIIGYSGHAYVVLDTASLLGMPIVGYCDRQRNTLNPFNIPYLGNEMDLEIDPKANWRFIICIGDNLIRRHISKKMGQNFVFSNIIHPNTQISKTCKIGVGNFMNVGVVLNAFAQIGNHVILNTNCIVEHECVISDFVHLAPGATLAGNVFVGESTFIGANATVKQGVKIGNNVIVGAGAVVIKDVPDNVTIVGNPAKIIKYHE